MKKQTYHEFRGSVDICQRLDETNRLLARLVEDEKVRLGYLERHEKRIELEKACKVAPTWGGSATVNVSARDLRMVLDAFGTVGRSEQVILASIRLGEDLKRIGVI